MDLCTNMNGNNLAVLNWNGNNPAIYYVKYYLLNSSGSVIRSSTIETYGPYQGSIEYVNISGNQNKVYVVYKIGNIIRAKKSIDAGISWTTHDLTNPLGSGAFYYLDIVFDNIANKLHVVYSRGDIGYPNQITHYYSLNENNQWSEYKQVSDYGDEWTKPTVSFSQNRVHVSYHEDGTKSRDKYLTTWQTPATLISYSLIERIHAGSSKLFYFYAEPQPDLTVDVYAKQRNLNGSSWSSPTLLRENADFYSPFVSATNTADGKTHIVYNGPGSTMYRNYNGSTWSSELTVGDWYENPLISSVSNDLFVIWMGSNNYIKYRQYDAAPLAPKNLTITKSANNHPLLSWLPNTEPDRNYYQLYRWDSYGGGWQPLAQTSNTSYEDATLTYCTAIPPAQCPDLRSFQFKVTAVDLGSHESDPSNIVESRLVGGPPSKAGANDPDDKNVFEYALGQNYPNPFNPTTTINYSIKTAGEVTLKVYDMLGTEVASIVNERQEAGSYTVEFNATYLPSGMYVYRLSTSNFVDTKKLILLK